MRLYIAYTYTYIPALPADYNTNSLTMVPFNFSAVVS